MTMTTTITTNKMRPIPLIALTIALFVSVPALAQHYVGVRGGYGGGMIRFEPARETGLLLGYPSGGVTWKYYSPTPVVGAIEVDLQYVKKGYKEYPRVNSDTSYQRTLSAVELPFFWQPHVYLFNRSARAFLNLGVYVSYIISSDSLTVSKTNGTLYSGSYPFRTVKDNRWEYGLCGGVGINVLIKRYEITAEARYSFGYSDIYKNTDKYPGNPRRSPVDMINISLGVGYRIGTGGIKAPPLSKKAREEYEP